ncbi:MAG: hypothetical protein ABIY55_13925, partial [Kofleriaceae bacterium]
MKLGIAMIVCVLGGVAHADRADVLFKKGKKLLAEKHYAEACTAFEDSDRLDPGIGAKLNVAKCYQEWGRLATAWRWFGDAERMARSAKDDRAKKIHALMEELDAEVPRLTVKLAPGADRTGLDVQLDDTPLAAAELGVARRVDPGPHHIDYVVNGAKLSKTVPVERGGASEVVLDIPGKPIVRAPAPPEPAPAAVPAPVAGNPGHSRRILGLGVAAAGVVAVGIAGIVTLGARSDYQQALTDHCRGATDMCDAEGLTQTHAALDTAHTQTV